MSVGLTAFGRYLRDTGTNATWLARLLGVSGSKVSRWCTYSTGMSAADQARVLAVLRARAALSLDGLFDDQPEFHDARGAGRTTPRPRSRAGDSPFEALARAALDAAGLEHEP